MRCLDRPDWEATDVGIDIGGEHGLGLGKVILRPTFTVLVDPLFRYCLEGICRLLRNYKSLRFSVSSRMDPSFDKFTRYIPLHAGLLQADLRILAQCEQILAPIDAIPVAPALRSSRLYCQMQTCTVGQLVRLVGTLRIADARISESCRHESGYPASIPSTIPAFLSASSKQQQTPPDCKSLSSRYFGDVHGLTRIESDANAGYRSSAASCFPHNPLAACATARNRARPLFMVSSHSFCGSES